MEEIDNNKFPWLLAIPIFAQTWYLPDEGAPSA